MGSEEQSPTPKSTGWRGRILGVGVTTVAVVLGVVHAIWPKLKIDYVTLVLVVIALVPWIGGIVENIELPGGFKVGLRQAREMAALAMEQAASASVAATTALSAATTTRRESIDQLADEYVRILQEVPPSSERTLVLDGLVGQLAALTAEPGFSWVAAIQSSHPGHQLAALAYAYTHPEPEMLPYLRGLAKTPLTSNYMEYWAIRAWLAVVVTARGSTGYSIDTLESLRALRTRLRELEQILRLPRPVSTTPA